MQNTNLRIRVQIPAGFSKAQPEEHIETIFTTIEELLLQGPPFLVSHSMTTLLSVDMGSGLLDKKGIEIFENDIVKWKVGTLWVEGPVFYQKECGAWLKGNNQNAGSYQKSTEIIGTTHEKTKSK